MSVRREHFTSAEKARPIEEVRREHDELRDPLVPVKAYAKKLEEIREASLELMHLADQGELPAFHMDAAGIRERVERAQVHVSEWVSSE